MRNLSVLALLAAAALFAPLAHADTSVFTITSLTDSTFQSITFSLPTTPDPASLSHFSGDEFDVAINGTITTASGTSAYTDTYQFYDAYFGGGMIDNGNFQPYGPVLYSGDVNNPTFLDGTFNLYDDGDYATDGALPDYAVNISSTPEPSSLVLLGTGVLGLADMFRRRRTA